MTRDPLVAAVSALKTAESQAEALRGERDRLICQAHAAGARQTDLAKIVGISQQAIARIIKTTTQPAKETTMNTEAHVTTIDGETHTGPTLREVLNKRWGKRAKISGEFGRLAVTIPLDGGVAKLAEVQSYDVSDADRMRGWEVKHRLMGPELTATEIEDARTRFAKDGTLPEDAPTKHELWLIQ